MQRDTTAPTVSVPLLEQKLEAPPIGNFELMRLKEMASQLHPQQVVTFADMSGTTIFQRSNLDQAFPPENRRSLASFINSGGIHVVVTGDSLETVEKFIVQPLKDLLLPEKSYFVISAAGWEISRVTDGRVYNLQTGAPIDETVRREIFEELTKVMGLKDALQSDIEIFMSGRGHRSNVTEKLQRDSGVLLFEAIPNKFSIFGPEPGTYLDHNQRLFRAIAEHPRIREIAASAGLHIIVADNFIDIISTTKDEGIRAFLAHKEVKSLALESRWGVAVGDARNDLGIFHEVATRFGSNSLRVFVGTNDHLVETELNPQLDPNFFFLKGTYIRGLVELNDSWRDR